MTRYIYLDWNVIQYMKHERVVPNKFDAVKFREFVDELRSKYKFPASEGHLRDLASTLNSSSEKYINEDLKFLDDISNGIMLGIHSDDEMLIPTKENIEDQFKMIASEDEPEPVFSAVGESHEVDMKALPSKSLLRPLLEKNSGIIDSKLMEDFLGSIWENMDSPDFYKNFRSEIASLSITFAKTDTILSQDSAYFKKIESFMKIGNINDLDVLIKEFNDIFVSFLAIDNKKIEDLKKGEKIQAVPEEDVDRTSAEGKASSVQFIHFKFTDEQIAKFKNSSEIEIGIDHAEYSHTTKLAGVTIKSLSADFN